MGVPKFFYSVQKNWLGNILRNILPRKNIFVQINVNNWSCDRLQRGRPQQPFLFIIYLHSEMWLKPNDSIPTTLISWTENWLKSITFPWHSGSCRTCPSFPLQSLKGHQNILQKKEKAFFRRSIEASNAMKFTGKNKKNDICFIRTNRAFSNYILCGLNRMSSFCFES